MMDDQIERIVSQAHELFDKTSIFEVFDLPNREDIIKTLVEFYGPTDMESIDRYLALLDQLRREEEWIKR